MSKRGGADSRDEVKGRASVERDGSGRPNRGMRSEHRRGRYRATKTKNRTTETRKVLGAMLMLIRETLLLTVRNEFMAAPEETGAEGLQILRPGCI